MKKKFILLTLITVLFCTPAISKTFSTNRVDSKEDWSVFVDSNPTQCWVVSAPNRTRATRNGKSIKVNRSEIQLFALFQPSQSNYAQISFTSGYPFKNKSVVKISIGSSEHMLLQTDGEWAWVTSKEENEALLESLRRGVKALVSGTSSKGTRTKDTFSLLGFSAAFAEAQKRCGT